MGLAGSGAMLEFMLAVFEFPAALEFMLAVFGLSAMLELMVTKLVNWWSWRFTVPASMSGTENDIKNIEATKIERIKIFFTCKTYNSNSALFYKNRSNICNSLYLNQKVRIDISVSYRST